jgi:hypothetical protein
MLILDAIPEIFFDVRSRRWKYRDSKAFASMEAVKNQANKYLRSQQHDLVLLGKKYLDGKLSLKQFQLEAGQKIKGIHLAEMIRATNKQGDVKADLFLLVGRNLKQQYYSGKDPLTKERFGLKYLVEDLVAGKVSDRQLANRLSMFGESGKVSHWGTKSAIAKDNYTEARRILGKAEHCAECVEYSKRGWSTIENAILPTIACSCRTRCKCSLEYR